MIRAIAIDDEPIALDIIESHANKIPFLELKASFTNAYQAIEFLKTNSVDLLFLDVKMPDISGIDFLKSLSNTPLVIFTTAYQEYALESYDFQTVDYLLKPFDFGRFLKAVNKASDRLEQKNDQHLFLKTGYEYVRLEIAKVKYAKAEGNYVKFVTEGQQVLSRMTMQQAESMLLAHGFLKAHRSYLVNPHLIQKLEKHQLSIDGEIIPIGATFYEPIVLALPTSN